MVDQTPRYFDREHGAVCNFGAVSTPDRCWACATRERRNPNDDPMTPEEAEAERRADAAAGLRAPWESRPSSRGPHDDAPDALKSEPCPPLPPAGGLSEFTETDWYGWAGATRFADGSEPLIAQLAATDWPEPLDKTFDGQLFLIVDGGDGGEEVTLTVSGDRGFVLLPVGNKRTAVALAEALLAAQPVPFALLMRMGFLAYDLPSGL